MSGTNFFAGRDLWPEVDDDIEIRDDTFVFFEGPRFSNGDFTSKEHEARMRYELLREREIRFVESITEVRKIFCSLGYTTEDECARATMETEIQNIIDEFRKVA
jgi:hypothetical protein